MSIYRILLIFVTGLLLFSCSDSGNSDSSPTGTSPQFYDVTVSKTPSDAGTISPSADSSYEEGSTVSLEANPIDAYTFSGWTGAVDTSANPFTITVDKNYNLTANFLIKSYMLVVNTTGEGTVTEQVLQQKTDYEHGTVVELTANPANGWKFVEWQGDVTGSDNPAQITVDNPKSVTAVFEKKAYTLTVNTAGQGVVTEEVVQAKATDYEFGTAVELTANPANGWKFFEWQGDLTGSMNPEQITVDTAKTVTAVFEKKTYAVNISTSGEGTVSKSPDQVEYEYNSTVDLTADPATGWQFVEWQGDTSSTTNPLSVTVDTTKNFTAVFEKKSFTLTVNISGNGSVTKNPDQTEYEFGTLVDLTASPDADWEFETWDGDRVSTNNPITISIDSAITITAVFTNPTFAGGNGTQTYPFEVSTLDQLQAINNYTSSHFVQINDIDASPTSTWNGGKGFRPIGDDIIPFSGSYDGQSFSIQSLYIDRKSEDLIGLFGFVETVIIKDLSLLNADVRGNINVGILIGASEFSDISDIFVSGMISGTKSVGGIIGENKYGEIANAENSSSVSGQDQNIGGLIGLNDQGKIFDSISNSNIEGSSQSFYVGGLVGSNSGMQCEIVGSSSSGTVKGKNGMGGLLGFNGVCNIDNSFSTSDVTSKATSTEPHIGGLIGRNIDAKITNSYALGDIAGLISYSGGLIGRNTGEVIDSYAEGNIDGENHLGGLIGQSARGARIKNSYSYGSVISNGDYNGGLVGQNLGSIERSKSNCSVNGKNIVGGLVGINEGNEILNSYSTGAVDGEESVGGLVGINDNYGNIETSYASGSVTGTTDVGGLIGTNGGSISGSYWDTQSSGQTSGVGRGNTSGVTGLSTSEMTGTSAETNMSAFDFVNIWVTTSSYPALFWE